MAVCNSVYKRAEPYIDDATRILAGHRFIKVRKLAEKLSVSPTIAGCVLHAIGWIPWNEKNNKANKTYQRPIN